MGLTTHVLDTANGRPGAGVPVVLHALRDGARVEIARTVTNSDGRTDAPLAATLEVGIYELTFSVAGLFAVDRPPATASTPPFLSDVTIRVGIADPAAHYHVPLLVSPYGYSTYRGS